MLLDKSHFSIMSNNYFRSLNNYLESLTKSLDIMSQWSFPVPHRQRKSKD